MISFILGIALGAAFAPFWMMVWTNYIKPVVDSVISKVKTK